VRTFLVTGPGGAGTSTLSAAVAVREARAGHRVTLLTRRCPVVADLGAVAGLTVATVDPQSGLERFWAGHADLLAGLAPGLDLPPAASVVPVPGTAEVSRLAALARIETDVLVVDAGPLDDAVALVGLPGALRWWLDQLMPARLRALAALGGVLPGAAVPGDAPGGIRAALAALPALEQLVAGGPLADPGAVQVLLVATARTGDAAALRSAATALALHGAVPAAVLARVLPGDVGPWWAARVAEQDAVLPRLAEVGPLVAVAERPTSPLTADDLAGLLPAAGLPTAAAAAPPAPVRAGNGWEMTVALPFAERGGVELTRFGDVLVLTAAGARRSVRLDPLLRRCLVTGGRLDAPGGPGARLVVGFEPDPDLWPADLLAAHGSTA
jgi:arsenite/tail-anchored protein-transporting ATPase